MNALPKRFLLLLAASLALNLFLLGVGTARFWLRRDFERDGGLSAHAFLHRSGISESEPAVQTIVRAQRATVRKRMHDLSDARAHVREVLESRAVRSREARCGARSGAHAHQRDAARYARGGVGHRGRGRRRASPQDGGCAVASSARRTRPNAAPPGRRDTHEWPQARTSSASCQNSRYSRLEVTAKAPKTPSEKF